MSLLTWQSAVVKEIVQRAEHTRSYFLEVPELESFNFIPGQFVSLDLPIHERPSQRMRSYSIASSPDRTNVFELLISHKAGGRGSTYLFENVSVGSEIKFRGPQGVFVLPDILEREICMICTGTGIAPFRSQVKYLIEHGAMEKPVHLIFGTRHLKDLLYFDELTALAKQHPQFHFYVTLSRESAAAWSGKHGYVHEIYKEISENGNRDLDFYLCGWRNMINDARDQITAMGYERGRIHLESYD